MCVHVCIGLFSLCDVMFTIIFILMYWCEHVLPDPVLLSLLLSFWPHDCLSSSSLCSV